MVNQLTVGGLRLMTLARRSWGPMLECLLMGRVSLLPPGELAVLGAILIFGGIIVLSERRRIGKAVLVTRRKLLSDEP